MRLSKPAFVAKSSSVRNGGVKYLAVAIKFAKVVLIGEKLQKNKLSKVLDNLISEHEDKDTLIYGKKTHLS